MNSIVNGPILSVSSVCAQATADPISLIRQEETRYQTEIEQVADRIHDERTNRHIVLLTGPSSAGKTTTASRLEKELEARGTAAHVVSLDDFYLGEGKAPLLPDGSPDYETIDALDVDRLMTCLQELVRDGKTSLPVFDFVTHGPLPEERMLVLEEDAAVILEGIHAFNPKISACLPPENITRLFINALSRFEKDGETWLKRRDMRLIRRILRDEQFRGSPFANTMKMWPQVVRGEELYLFPYADAADCVIDTTFAFEPCIIKSLLLPRLAKVERNTPDYDTARYLIERLSVFCDLPLSLLPADSMLREFTG